MKNDLQNTIAEANDKFLNALDLFNQDTINTVPFEGSWTGGQVAEHILKSVSGILETLNGPLATTNRNPEEHVKMLGEVFLNMDIKMQSPDFIIPSNSPKDKAFLETSLVKIFEGIEESAGKDDLAETCRSFEMPTIGLLTKSEWIQFAGFHTRRHALQLKNIAGLLKKVKVEQ